MVRCNAFYPQATGTVKELAMLTLVSMSGMFKKCIFRFLSNHEKCVFSPFGDCFCHAKTITVLEAVILDS